MSEVIVESNHKNPSGITEAEISAKKITGLVYLLQALGLVMGVTLIVAVIINYVKNDDVRGTVAESHFRWQVRTFWFALLWWSIGAITSFVFIGVFILGANTLWVIYRVVKGGLFLNDGKPMYA